jgi:hypothetical protein
MERRENGLLGASKGQEGWLKTPLPALARQNDATCLNSIIIKSEVLYSLSPLYDVDAQLSINYRQDTVIFANMFLALKTLRRKYV